MRIGWLGIACILAGACAPASSEPVDAAMEMDAARDVGDLLTDAYAEGAAPPNVACGPDVSAALGFDPCTHWVMCIPGDAGMDWAATFSSGTCEAGRCAFADAPVLTQCARYCFQSGAMGRCANPGPTAP